MARESDSREQRQRAGKWLGRMILYFVEEPKACYGADFALKDSHIWGQKRLFPGIKDDKLVKSQNSIRCVLPFYVRSYLLRSFLSISRALMIRAIFGNLRMKNTTKYLPESA